MTENEQQELLHKLNWAEDENEQLRQQVAEYEVMIEDCHREIRRLRELIRNISN